MNSDTPQQPSQLSLLRRLSHGILFKPEPIQTFVVKYAPYREHTTRETFNINKVERWESDINRRDKQKEFSNKISKAIDNYIKFNNKKSPITFDSYYKSYFGADELFNLALIKVTITKDDKREEYTEPDVLTKKYTFEYLTTKSHKLNTDSPAGPGNTTIEVTLDMTKLNARLGQMSNLGGTRRSSHKYKKSVKRIRSAKRSFRSRKYRSRK